MIRAKDLYIEMQEQIAFEISEYEKGNAGVLDTLTSLKRKRMHLENGLAAIKKFEYDNTEEIESSSKDYGGKYNGFSIEVRQGRKTYDFSNVKEVRIAEDNVKELKEYYKKAFEAKQKNILTATEDGEEIELPELKYSKPSVIVKEINN